MACRARAEPIPVPSSPACFSLPAQSLTSAYHNKAVIYDIMFKARCDNHDSTIAADPSALAPASGPSILQPGVALTHHPTSHDRASVASSLMDALGRLPTQLSSSTWVSLTSVSAGFVLRRLAAATCGRALQFFAARLSRQCASLRPPPPPYFGAPAQQRMGVLQQRPFVTPAVLRYLAPTPSCRHL